MKKLLLVIFILVVSIHIGFGQTKTSELKTIAAKTLKDKIAGGWAGKMIGVTYGAPVEFRALGLLTKIQ